MRIKTNKLIGNILFPLIVLDIIVFIIGRVFVAAPVFKGKEIKFDDLDTISNHIKDSLYYDKEFSMIMVGDALIHKSIYDDAYNGSGYDFTRMLSRIKPITSKYDVAYYNQETVLGGVEIGLSTYPRFNSPYEVGDAFLDAGFNMVSLANNHSLDRGKTGITNSVNYWNKHSDVLTAGSYLSEEQRIEDRIFVKNDISYTMLSYTTDTNGLSIPNGENYLVNVYDAEKVKQDIERVRDKVDFLIVAMHWGQEYTNTPVQSQKNIAKYLSELDVDLIIGCHPHVIEPVEYVGNTMVIYSLGNVVSSQNGPNNLTGLMMSIKVHKKLDSNGSSVTIEEPTARLVYTYYEEKSVGRRNYMIYPYEELNESILPNYASHYERFTNIAIGSSNKINKYPLNP
jgi:poly-gamma-glutamate synthesis protein (capsule biosynthesis protein)